MSRSIQLVVAWCAALAFATLAVAQDAQTIEQQLADQRAKLEQLEKQLQEVKAGQLAKSAETKKEVENNKVKLSLEYDGGFKMFSPDKRFLFQVTGRIQADAQARLAGKNRNHGASSINGFKERRTYLGVRGVLYKYWTFTLSGEYEGGTVRSDTSNYVGTTYIPNTEIRIGQDSVPFTLEGETSNNDVKPIERSMIVNFVSPFYNQGLRVNGSYFDGRVNVFAMLGNGNETERSDNDDDKIAWGRLVLLPFKTSDNKWIKKIHLGVSGGIGNQDRLAPGLDGGTTVSTAPGTPVIAYDPGVTYDGDSQRAAAEAAWHVGPFGIWGEYIWYSQDLRNGTTGDPRGAFSRLQTAEFTGGEVTVAYLLTGEDMTFGTVVPKNNFEPGHPDSGPGAWELVARYDWVKVERGDTSLFIGGLNVGGPDFVRKPERVEQVMAGVNWYPNPAVKVSLQYQRAWWSHGVGEGAVSAAPAPAVGSPKQPKNQDTLMMRVQIKF